MDNIAIIKNKFYECNNIYFESYIQSLEKTGNDSHFFVKNNISKLFKIIFKIRRNHSNLLLFGDVQSGKTNNIYGTLTKFLDTNVDIIIFIGGINNILLNQTDNRSPLFDFIDKGLLSFYKAKNFSYINNNSSKTIIFSMKNYKHLSNILNQFSKYDLKNKKIVIVDDECDFATSSNKTVSNIIDEIRNQFLDSIYIGVTATPFSNLMFSEFNNILLLDKSENYTGIDYFNKNRSLYYKIINSYKENEKTWYSAIKLGIKEYTYNSFYNYNRFQKKDSQILINITENTKEHNNILEIVDRVLIDLIDNFDFEFKEIVEKLNDLYDNLNKKIQIKFSILDFLRKMLGIKKILLNSKNFKSDEYKKVTEGKYPIVIGGYMISRGFTFENLCVEVLLNGKEDKNAVDTLLQRARWLGYRNKDFKISIILNENILNTYIDTQNIIADVKLLLENYSINNFNLQEMVKALLKKYKKVILTNKRG